jgi:hypothetical protein
MDGWPVRQRIWPWATALTGLSVSVAGNIGHIQAAPGQPVIVADRLTAATSPLAAFAGLAIGLLVLKMTRRQDGAKPTAEAARTGLVLATDPVTAPGPDHLASAAVVNDQPGSPAPGQEPAGWPSARAELLSDASAIHAAATTRGEWLSQRALARQLRERGHRFPNDQLHHIAAAAQLAAARAA